MKVERLKQDSRRHLACVHVGILLGRTPEEGRGMVAIREAGEPILSSDLEFAVDG